MSSGDHCNDDVRARFGGAENERIFTVFLFELKYPGIQAGRS